MKIKWKRFNRKVHYWGAILCAIPILVVIGSGILLLLKKDIDWIQPPSAQGQGKVPILSFEQILEVSKTVEQAQIKQWSDIKRLDIRPKKGIVKIRSKNKWEIQIDQQTADILQVAYRRSDLIESIHDGTFFHDSAKLWLFLPAAVILFILWVTGLYLFIITELSKNRSKRTHFLALNKKTNKALLRIEK